MTAPVRLWLWLRVLEAAERVEDARVPRRLRHWAVGVRCGSMRRMERIEREARA